MSSIRHRGIRAGALVVLCCLLVGCASPSSPQFSVPAGMYPKAFDATRDLLRNYRFALERVDAAAGVITTAHKTSAGLATLWDKEQTTLGQEFEDLLNQESRVVRITFRPRTPSDPEASAGEPIDPSQELIGRVEVIVYRIQTPGLRPPSKAISLTSMSTDPQAVSWAYEVPVSQDSRFAARLAAKLAERIGPGARAATPGADDDGAPATRLARP